MPNRLLLYVWLGNATDRRSGYDAIDANVDLPPLTIATVVEHELKVIDLENPVASFNDFGSV